MTIQYVLPHERGMKTIYTDKEYSHTAPCVATIGFFDGVHSGHKYLIRSVLASAEEGQGMESMVITFERHPQQVLRDGYRPKLLSTNNEKTELLARTGIDNCVMLHFDRKMAALSAREFMKTVLLDKLNVRKLIIGYDNRFGHDRSESFKDYAIYGQELGIGVMLGDVFTLNGNKVSSSVVRSFLSEGKVEEAEMCLGYPYFIQGNVVQGVHEGRKLGFPTANICVNDELKLIPETGVYAVKVNIDGSSEMWDAMMNIGTRPTFGDNRMTIEAHIFGFEGDLYGKKLCARFIHRLRGERKFTSADELSCQLRQDMEAVKRMFE